MESSKPYTGSTSKYSGEKRSASSRNGAGKTTTIKILCTLAKATSGRATVAGHDTSTEQDKVRRMIGLVFQDTTLDSYLTAEQNLRFHAALYAVPAAAVEPRMRQVLDMVGLWDRKDGLVSTFSGGMQRRLEITRWFVCTHPTSCSSTSRPSASTRRRVLPSGLI